MEYPEGKSRLNVTLQPMVCKTSGMKFMPVPTSEDVTSYNYSDEEDIDYIRQAQKSLNRTFREENDPEVQCGIGSWRPSWLQRFANHRVYAASFIIVGIVQGMIYSYFNGVITTVEKAFGIPSRTLGIILSGNDISQILCGLLLTYAGGKGSRPLWLALGMLLTAASCFMYSSAQLFWDGDAVQLLSKKVELTSKGYNAMCGHDREGADARMVDPSFDPCADYPSNVPALVVFFIGQFVSGVGSTALFSLGFSYMDDNVKKSVSPLYMTLTSALRSLGPTIGYTLASFCLKTYIDPSRKPEYSPQDPRWLGAWWLGFLIVGTLQVFITFPIALFPKRLKSATRKPNNALEKTTSVEGSSEVNPISNLKDFFASIGRLLSNPIIAFSLCGAGPLIMGIIGYSTFLPKYLEAQFKQTASQATVFTGISGMAMIMVGSFIGGLVTYKFQPRTTYVATYAIIVDVMYVVGVFINMNFDCDSLEFSGASVADGRLQANSTCSLDCNCPEQFNPVCVGGENFLSPCFAGCSSYVSKDEVKTYFNCTCANPSILNESYYTSNYDLLTATSGYCPASRQACKYLWPYIIILGTVKLLASSTRVGGLLIFVRAVEKRDKALSMALMGVITSLLGFIPSPIVYGAVVDSTCLVWEITPCGKKGNCWLYNIDDFRYYFHGITMICFIITIVFDVLTTIYARRINLYSDTPPSQILSFKDGLLCKPKKISYERASSIAKT